MTGMTGITLPTETVSELKAEIAHLRAELDEALEVVRPFSFAAPYWEGFHDYQQITHRNHSLEVGHLRAARRFYEKHKGGGR